MKQLTLALMFSLVSIASANEVAVYGGPSIVSLNHETDGTVLNMQGHSPSFGGQVLFSVVPGFQLGVDALHNNLVTLDNPGAILTTVNGVVDSALTIPTQEHLSYDTTVLMLTAKLQPEDSDFTWYKPYLALNAGIHRTHLQQTSTITDPRYTWYGNQNVLTEVNETKTGTAIGFALGTDFPITKTTFIGAEFRYTYLGRVNYDVPAETQATGFGPNAVAVGGVSILNALFKVGIKF